MRVIPLYRIKLIISVVPSTTDRDTGRRRKKSCVPRPANPGTCEECFARGVQCCNQEVSLGTKRRAQSDKNDLQQRVTELETALLSISQKLETTPGTIEPDNTTTKPIQHTQSPVTSSNSTSETFLKHAPVLSLFDNDILSRHPDDSGRDGISSVEPGKHAHVRKILLSFFPSDQDQETILNDFAFWWSSWQEIYPQIFGAGPFSNVIRFFADVKESDSVQRVAKALLCLFIVLQEGCVAPNTISDMANQTSQALTIIDEMVLNDDGLAGTIDGIECIMLRAKYEMNCGRIRKAWLTFRRGISFAQLSGLHKRSANSTNDSSQSVRAESLWKALYSGDRFLSLMLGLPYGPSEIHSDIGRDSESSAKGIKVENTSEHYFYRLSNIVGHIIDRNQQLPSNNMLPLTFKIESEMMELAGTMTSEWWKSGRDPYAANERMASQLLPQFWHYQARSLLHLPFMLKATTDRLQEYSKMATVESAREMIARYRVIRPAQGFGSHICKMIDFQVFTAAMILVLNLLDHYRKTETFNNSEAESDQDLILITTDILRRASNETDGGVATQAARALEMFGKIKEMPLPVGKYGGDCTAKVVIPYFGTVTIGPGTNLRGKTQRQNSEAMVQPRQLPTPSDQSLDGSTPNSATQMIEPTIPFDFNYNDNSQDTGVYGDFFANINFDLDQDWSWYWNNIDVPSVDVQGSVG